MPKITIRESDQTGNRVYENTLANIVYVPGFAASGSIGKGIPTLCTTVDEFKTYFGNSAAVFASKQDYSTEGSAERWGSFPSAAYTDASGAAIPMFAAGDEDPAWNIAYNLIADGVPVVYERVNGSTDTISIETMYLFLTTAFIPNKSNPSETSFYDNALYDKNAVDIKFVTTGGYPSFEFTDKDAVKNSVVKSMLGLCSSRGDCIALIDHTNNPDRKAIDIYNAVQTGDYALSGTTLNYGAMFTPWVDAGIKLPGSYAYLISLAESVKASPNWLAIAGVTRGVVPTISGTTQNINNSVANYLVDSMSHGGICINPITNIRNYGLTIWGNRTLESTTTNTEKALYYLNMRSMVCEVKKTCYYAAQEQMFEQNSDILWINFKAKVMATLDKMASSNGLSGYKIIKEPTKSKTEIKATIKLYPIYAVEAFDITVILTNDDVEVAEE